jgi:CheY-like chemotaxis protein
LDIPTPHDQQSSARANGPRRRNILVVEDEMLVAMLIEDMLAGLGYGVIGPVSELEAAMRAVRDEPVDAAILDLNLRGKPTYPVAEICRDRGLPFLFATGYGADSLEDAYGDVGVLQKPFQEAELAAALARLLSGEPP